jgi:SEC-C motif
MTVSRQLELAGQDDDAAVVREAVTVSFGGEGLPLDPLDQLPDTLRAVAAEAPAGSVRAAKVGRNAACPCGSGKKVKKCCGSPRAAGDRD